MHNMWPSSGIVAPQVGETVENTEYGNTGEVLKVTMNWAQIEDSEFGDRWVHRECFEDGTWIVA